MAKKATRPTQRRDDRRTRPPVRPTPVARPKQVFPTPAEESDGSESGAEVEVNELIPQSRTTRPASGLRMVPSGSRPSPAFRPAGGTAAPASERLRVRPATPLFVDYSYVRRDLLRIAVLAFVMFAVLIVLTFVYR